MSAVKHTPGPWRRGSGTGGRYSVVSDQLAAGALGGSNVIDYYGGNLIAESIAPENILLIAAAPDLLATLQRLIDIEGPQPGTAEWADEARAVIRKATGESA